jgi:hypothetical protein
MVKATLITMEPQPKTELDDDHKEIHFSLSYIDSIPAYIYTPTPLSPPFYVCMLPDAALLLT